MATIDFNNFTLGSLQQKIAEGEVTFTAQELEEPLTILPNPGTQAPNARELLLAELKRQLFNTRIYMVDLETTGLQAGCGIVQIGVVGYYNGKIDRVFNALITPEDNAAHGLNSDKETMEWWNRQEPEVQDYVFAGNAGLMYVLNQLSCFAFADPSIHLSVQYPAMWIGKQYGFDFNILDAAYEAVGLTPPYTFRQTRDLRSHFDILKPVIPEGLVTSAGNAKHEAVMDATKQLVAYVAGLANLVQLLEGQ